jgi:hypothetical protein
MHSSIFLIIGILASIVAPSAAANVEPFTNEPFSDVPESSLNYDAIEYLRQNNVIRGYPDGTFRPDTRLNRAELLQLMTNPFLISTDRLNDCVGEEITPKQMTYVFYTDVGLDSWYASAVCLATVQKIVNGYPDKTFRPGNYVTFVEAAKMIGNVLSFSVTEEPGEQWYEPYVRKLSERNAIPTTVGSLSETITRGEIAEMIFRLKTNLTTKQSRTAEALRN